MNLNGKCARHLQDTEPLMELPAPPPDSLMAQTEEACKLLESQVKDNEADLLKAGLRIFVILINQL